MTKCVSVLFASLNTYNLCMPCLCVLCDPDTKQRTPITKPHHQTPHQNLTCVVNDRVVHTLSSFNLYRDALEEPEECFDDLSDAISDPTTQ